MRTLFRDLISGLLATAVAFFPLIGVAQTYPAKPLRLVVGFAAGSGQDVLARVLASQMSLELGQQMIVDNRPAAGGVVAAASVSKAPPDGYTLLMGGSWLTVGSLVQRKPQYDPITSFSSIGQLATPQCILFVSPSVGTRTLKEFVDFSKINPDKLNYGSAGIGHPFHLGMEMFMDRSGAKLTHVPFPGMNVVINEVIAGRIHAFLLPGSASLKEFVLAGKLLPLVTVSDKRHPDFPDVPTLKEAGVPDFRVAATLSLIGPPGMSKDMVQRLNAAMVKAASTSEMLAAFKSASTERTLTGPDEYSEIVRKEVQTWKPLIESLKISIE